ncbi:MAG: hypothetical protein D0433_09050 [Candidatus Thermochlorobacter aerophilum]|uniref:Uncharacterized protein n=1 Tax=Candidatus Thermochlorobacter aerophilus TaxID=1868324 RepID=A0A395LZB1_9BACT|nr:MAG: hypothetical protein D0433_09050 [Candidatus Thermochlorobacter aerophilum]
MPEPVAVPPPLSAGSAVVAAAAACCDQKAGGQHDCEKKGCLFHSSMWLIIKQVTPHMVRKLLSNRKCAGGKFKNVELRL